MTTIGLTTRDVARELARRYSTMTHDELDVLESILVPMKFQKGEIILKEGDICEGRQNSVLALQSVAMTGFPINIASAMPMPKPSPL